MSYCCVKCIYTYYYCTIFCSSRMSTAFSLFLWRVSFIILSWPLKTGQMLLSICFQQKNNCWLGLRATVNLFNPQPDCWPRHAEYLLPTKLRSMLMTSGPQSRLNNRILCSNVEGKCPPSYTSYPTAVFKSNRGRYSIISSDKDGEARVGTIQTKLSKCNNWR